MSENFYIVLPSNACPLTQPNNQANSFIVDWQSAITLDGKWEVALTEFSLNYTPYFQPKATNIHFKQILPVHDKVELIIAEGDFLFNTGRNSHNNIFITQTKDLILTITSKSPPFNFKFDTQEDALNFGFNEMEQISKDGKIVSQKPLDLTLSKNVFITIESSGVREYPNMITFNEYPLFPNSDDLMNYFQKHCTVIFEEFQIDQNGMVYFRIKKGLDRILIDPELSKNLGFENNILFNYEAGEIHQAKKQARLANSFNQVYIYSSVTEPILVGGVRVPLLRAIWIESKYRYGEVVHENIDNLMYLPISSSSINNIECEIRNDSGQLINFPYGSKTNLTLHFRKINE